jgi:hypothetical protein
VLRILNVKTRSRIALSVRRASTGELVYLGDHTAVKSGIEFYGPDVSSLEFNELIWVEASKPSAN